MPRELMKKIWNAIGSRRAAADAGGFERAAGRLRKIFAKTGGDPATLYQVLGEELSGTSRHEEAANAFRAVIAARPDEPGGYLGAANALLLADKPGEAAGLWSVVRRRFPFAYTDGEQRKHAQSLLRSGSFDEANRLFEHLLDTRPDMPWGLAGLARVAEQTRRWDEAARLWERCLEDHAGTSNPSWGKSLERCRNMANGKIPSMPLNEKTARSDSARAYFRLVSDARDQEGDRPVALNFPSVLVVTYGRSGSTLLQGVLNSIDGMLLRGENGNVFFDLFKAYDALSVFSAQNRHARNPNSAWFGICEIDLERVMDDFRRVARTVLLSDRIDDDTVTCFGFKEIRYDEIGDRFDDYLRFLELLFPKTGFVFLTRELDDVVRSAWWKERDPDEVRRTLAALEDRFAAFADGRPDCFRLTYEDMVARSEKLRAMFEFLGAPYRPDDLDIVMATPHSYEPTQASIRQLFRES